MYLSSRIIENAAQPNQGEAGGIVLDLSLKQLISIKGIEKYLEPNEVDKLLLSTNYIPTIDQTFQLFSNLKDLDMSINHISCIENLESLQNLRLLNLSNNRISQIENLSKLKNLEVLDLSMNYIERIENIKNKNLTTLILSGNNIGEIENLHHLKRLQNLEIEKNRIENISNLTIFGLKDLKKIVFAYNKIPIEYFDDLLKLLEVMPSLEEINFLGNEITLNKLYKAKIIQFQNIKILDKLALKEPIKKHFEALRQDHDIQTLINKTKNEYLERMAIENQLKQATLEMIEKQKRQVEEVFEEHQQNLQDDMEYFFDQAKDLKMKRMEGLDAKITEDMLDNWKDSVKKNAQERKQAFEEAKRKQQVLEAKYLESQLNSKKFTDKLYEISMKNPEIWKDIKLKEQELYQSEEGEMAKAKHYDPNSDESALQKYQDLENRVQINMMKDVANAVIDYEAKELHEQREKAANVLKHALLKQMVNHYTSARNKGIELDESPPEDTEQSNFNTNMNTTEDQLKEMLHSRTYKDGKWQNDKRQSTGPKNLSNQSYEDLLNLEKKQGAIKGTKQPKPNKKPQSVAIPEEHEDDEGTHRPSPQKNLPQRLSQPSHQHFKTPSSDELMRDPFAPNDEKTYYNEEHVVAQQGDEKVILIPFQESNLLDELNAPNPVKKGAKKGKKGAKDPEKKKTKKKADKFQNMLAALDEEPEHGNHDNYDNHDKHAEYLNDHDPVDIPEYQMNNRPYNVTLKKENEGDPDDIDGQDRQAEQERMAQKTTKSKFCNIF